MKENYSKEYVADWTSGKASEGSDGWASTQGKNKSLCHNGLKIKGGMKTVLDIFQFLKTPKQDILYVSGEF